MAVNIQKFLPSSKGGALAKIYQKVISTKTPSGPFSEKTITDIGIIKVKVIEIDNLLKGTLASQKKNLDDEKRLESSKRRGEQEEKLETKPKAEKGSIKMPQLPKMGFLDWVKNFIGNIILGYFAVRMIDFLPKLIPIAKFLGQATDFVIDTGGKLLDGLVTFIDWGYKAYDATRGFLKDLGGDNFTKVFDAFNGAVGTLIETAIIATTVLATQGEGGVLDTGMDMLKDRSLGKGAQQAGQQAAQQAGKQVATQAGRTAGMGAGAVAAVVAGAGLLASALGEGAFQVRKIATKPIQDLEKKFNEDRNPITKIGRGIVLTMVRPLYGLFSTVGFLLDVVGAPFRYAIELLRYPFLSEEDKVKQAYNLAKFDARIREDLRRALNMVTLGLAFKEKGSFGNIYGNKGAQKQMMGKMAGGGITRGGKQQGAIKRTETKGEYKRVVVRKPGKVEIDSPGANVGGEEKILGIFPKSKKVNEVSPFDVVKKTGEELGKTDYFGPILTISSKITAGQLPTQQDYQNAGIGINLLIAEGIRQKQLKGGLVAAFAEGGLVDPDVLSAAETGGDVSNWVAKTFKGEIESNAQKTLRMIRENAAKKKSQEVQEPPSPDDMNIEDGYGEGGIATGLGVNKGVSVAKKLIADLGITPAQAAGIVGNFLYESAGMNPGEREGAPFGTPESPPSLGTLGVGYGWAQWTNRAPGDRLDKFLKSYGGDKGKIATDNDNYRYLMKELKGSESLKGMPTDDPQAASDWFRVNWERAGIPADKKRRKETLAVFDKIKGLTREQAKADVMKAGAIYSDTNLVGGNGKFIQGNSGASGGVHFHIGPGTQPGQVDTKYNADARKAAQQVVKHFLGKKSLYDGRRRASYTSGSDEEIMAAQKAHSADGGSPGGIDIQVGGRHPGAATRIPFPFAVTNMAERPGGFGVSAKIAGLNAFVAHGRYNEKGKLATQLGTRSSPPYTTAEGYAFHGRSFGIVPKGGMRLTLHDGEMYKVIDKDSVNLLGYDLTKEIIDIENRAQLVAKAPSIIQRLKAISGYTDYEQPEPEIVYVPIEVPVPVGGQYSQGGGSALVSFGGENNFSQGLYKGT